MKKYIIILLALLLGIVAAQAQQAIAQPYYGEGKIRFYNKDSAVAGSPCYTLDLSADINANWGATQGINDVVIYNNKLFVSIDNGNGEGGVLVYNYTDVYPAKTAGPVSVINPQNATGLPVAGIAIQPSTGNLYVGTFYTGASDAGIYFYTASSGYAGSSAAQLSSYYNDNSVDKYIANLAFDASGNLWFTEFDSAAYTNQFLICYPAVNKSNYIEISNNPTQYSTTSLTGVAGPSVYLLSQPEGITFDGGGNLWLANNNDNFACNGAGDGTLVKISATWITDTFMNIQATYSTSPPAHSTEILFIPGGKPGGLLLDHDTLYTNDQGQMQGTDYTSSGAVWKWNINSAFNSTDFAASGIHTTYPGNGLMALDNAQFSVASDCVPASINGIANINPSNAGALYPNPVNDLLYINAPAATISIYNVIGEAIQTIPAGNQTLQINTAAYVPGVYFARLQYADGTYTIKKFVKE
jgi:hypothetical protein